MIKKIVIVLIAFLSLASTASAGNWLNSTIARFLSPDASNLVGHWTFDGKDSIGGTIKDVSGFGHNGTATNMNASNYVSGIHGQALSFDGVNDYVTISNFTMPTTAGSIAFWWRPDETVGSGVKHEVVGIRNATPRLFDTYFYSDGRAYFGWYNAGNDSRTNALTSSYGLTTGKWHFIVMTWASSGSVVVYVDNVQKASTALLGSSLWTTTTTNMEFGRDSQDATSYSKMSLDDVRIYSKVLSSTERAKLYWGSRLTSKASEPNTIINASFIDENSGLKDGLVNWYTFDGKQATSTGTDESADVMNIPRGKTNHTTTYSPWQAAGKIGQGLKSTQNNYEYLQTIGTSFGQTDSYTQSAWIKMEDGLSASDYNSLWNAMTYSTDIFGTTIYEESGWTFNYEADGKLTVSIVSSYCSLSDLLTVTTTNATHIGDKSWHLYTWSYDGSSTASGVKIYEDGQPLALTTIDDALTGSPTSALISLFGPASSNGDCGDTPPVFGSILNNTYIDDFRVYNRVLSDAEVLTLYKSY